MNIGIPNILEIKIKHALDVTLSAWLVKNIDSIKKGILAEDASVKLFLALENAALTAKKSENLFRGPTTKLILSDETDKNAFN